MRASQYDQFLAYGQGFGLPLRLFAGDGIVANPGGGQANASPLPYDQNRVSVVATAGDSTTLPPALPGYCRAVVNEGANPMAVFPSGTDQINGLAGGTSVSQIPKSLAFYICIIPGVWHCQEVGCGYLGNLPTVSSTNGIVAKAGGGQAGATLLTTVINRITTVATIGDSTLLPPASPPAGAGLQMTVTNAAANSMNLFPNTGDAINGAAANAAFAIAGGKTAQLSCAVNGQWHAVLSA